MKQDATRNAAYTVDCEDYVHVVEFNPFESGDSGNLIAYGGSNYVVIGMCTFQEEEADIEGIQYKTLRTFHHGVRVDGIAWSPETKLDSLPPVIKFCTSAADMKIRLFTSDLQDKNEYKVLEGHSDFINDLVFHPKEGHEIASVSDDHTCRWSAISENLFATTGYPGKMASQFQIHHLGHSQVPAIQQKRTVAFLNQFVVHTVQFLNRFSTVCEEVGPGPVLLRVYGVVEKSSSTFQVNRAKQKLQLSFIHIAKTFSNCVKTPWRLFYSVTISPVPLN
ncbi:nucleoporin 37 [Cricetulus griseus]